MPVCDTHGALRKSDLKLREGEGYLVASSFMEETRVPREMVDRDMDMINQLGISKQAYAARARAMRGSTPWLLCSECVAALPLEKGDAEGARAAAQRWWADKSTPGFVPKHAANWYPGKEEHDRRAEEERATAWKAYTSKRNKRRLKIVAFLLALAGAIYWFRR